MHWAKSKTVYMSWSKQDKEKLNIQIAHHFWLNRWSWQVMQLLELWWGWGFDVHCLDQLIAFLTHALTDIKKKEKHYKKHSPKRQLSWTKKKLSFWPFCEMFDVEEESKPIKREKFLILKNWFWLIWIITIFYDKCRYDWPIKDYFNTNQMF